jgi:hypothetical protein
MTVRIAQKQADDGPENAETKRITAEISLR